MAPLTKRTTTRQPGGWRLLAGLIGAALVASSCRVERTWPTERGGEPPTAAPDGGGTGTSGGGFLEACGGPRDSGWTAGAVAVVCYALDAHEPRSALPLVAVHLDRGAVERVRHWSLPDDAGVNLFGVSGLAYDGARFVTSSRFDSPSGLYVLDPSSDLAVYLPRSSIQPVIAWTGVDWVADVAVPLGGLGRFPTLDAVCDGWPTRPLIRSSCQQISASGDRLYAATTNGAVDVHNLCTGALVGRIELQGPGVSISAISVVQDTLYVLDDSGDDFAGIIAFAVDGGARVDRLDVPGRPSGLHCATRPVLFPGGADAALAWNPRSSCPVAPSGALGDAGPVTCYLIDSTSDGSVATTALMAVDLSSGDAHEVLRLSLPQETRAPSTDRVLAFDGTRFLTTTESAGGVSWYLDPSDGGVSEASRGADFWAAKPGGAAWTGTDWLGRYASTSGVGGLGRFPTPEAMARQSPSHPVTRADYERFTAADGLLYGVRAGALEIRELCTGALLRTVPWGPPSGWASALSVAGGTLHALGGVGESRSIVSMELDAGTELSRIDVRGNTSGLFCTTRPL